MRELLLSMFGTYVFSQFSAVLGALAVWPAVQRAAAVPIEPADAFNDIEEEPDEATQPVIAPALAQWFREPFAGWSLAGSAPHVHVTAMGKSDNEGGPVGPDPTPEPERVVALRPMSALERLEGPTRRIIRDADGFRVEPWWIGARHRAPESRCRVPKFLGAPQATAEFPEVGRHRSGEYPVLDGAR